MRLLLKVFFTAWTSASMALGFAVPGGYERLMFYSAYLIDCAINGNAPTTIAPGCARFYTLPKPCDLNQFINYISQHRSNPVTKVTEVKFPGHPPLETADKIASMKLAGAVRPGVVIDKARNQPYHVVLEQVGIFIAKRIAAEEASRELRAMAHRAMQHVLSCRKAATVEAIVRDLDPGSDLETTKVVLKKEPLYASAVVTEAIDMVETSKQAGISTEELREALKSQNTFFNILSEIVALPESKSPGKERFKINPYGQHQHQLPILRYKKLLTTPSADVLLSAQQDANLPRQCQIVDIEETISIQQGPDALTEDGLIDLLREAGIKALKKYAIKMVPAYQSDAEVKTINVPETLAALGIKPAELKQVVSRHFKGGHRANIKALEQSLLTADIHLDPLAACQAVRRKRESGGCAQSVEFIWTEDLIQGQPVEDDEILGDEDETMSDAAPEEESLSLRRAIENANRLKEAARASPWLANSLSTVAIGMSSLLGGATVTALAVNAGSPAAAGAGAGAGAAIGAGVGGGTDTSATIADAVLSSSTTPLLLTRPVVRRQVSIEEAAEVIREVLSPKRVQQILRKWAPTRFPLLATRRRRRSVGGGDEWLVRALRPAVERALLAVLKGAVEEAGREMALGVS
ncbi:hypothetical protein CDD80_4322 [Ophiocordyceps camponoti-rufipedis]|uniref:Uncharacterized protein n=1 Tax=Ophiocordyceps camponoti-rufipedis TaxID=2004952 RepID=A0A2C5YSE3_9HYPO|nr:hypothetical protein CDD80_4322 [Ophiocordyceps camponoti-rufipedis]